VPLQESTESIIFLNLPPDSLFVQIVKCALAFVVLSNYPLALFPATEALDILLVPLAPRIPKPDVHTPLRTTTDTANAVAAVERTAAATSAAAASSVSSAAVPTASVDGVAAAPANGAAAAMSYGAVDGPRPSTPTGSISSTASSGRVRPSPAAALSRRCGAPLIMSAP
jgi:hypothetical protein